MQRQRARDATDLVIGLQRQQRLFFAGLDRDIPQQRQRMLHQGQLVALFLEVIEDAVGETRIDPATIDERRRFDRLAQLLAIHLRREEQRRVDDLGKPVIARTLAEEIGTHRDRDIDGVVALARQLEQHGDERIFLVVGAALFVAEQLLELIDDDQQGVARFGNDVAEDFGRRFRRARHRRGHQPANGTIAGVAQHIDERIGELIERMGLRTRLDDLPVRTARAHIAKLERRVESRFNQ